MLTKLKITFAQLTPSERKVADFILHHPTEVTYLTVQELAKKVGTSATTIMRLSAKLDYSVFAELQKVLQEQITQDITPKSRLMSGLSDIGNDELWSKILRHDTAQIDQLSTILSQDLLKQAVSTLATAQRTYITAVRSSLPVATFLTQNINRYRGERSSYRRILRTGWMRRCRLGQQKCSSP